MATPTGDAMWWATTTATRDPATMDWLVLDGRTGEIHRVSREVAEDSVWRPAAMTERERREKRNKEYFGWCHNSNSDKGIWT